MAHAHFERTVRAADWPTDGPDFWKPRLLASPPSRTPPPPPPTSTAIRMMDERLECFLTLMKINWGIGMMSMPYYVSLLGASTGVGFFVFTMVITYLGLDRLLRAADACEARVKQDYVVLNGEEVVAAAEASALTLTIFFLYSAISWCGWW